MPVAAWACSMFLAFSAICSASFDNTELLQTRADVSRERTRRSRAARDHDDFGNHMQMNPNISKTTFENHTQVHEGHQSFYANMDQTFLAMSANIDELEEGTSSDPDPQTTLANFKSMMENTIQVFMEAEHDQDQTEFDTKRTQHNSCSGAQRWQVGGDVANAAGELDKWQGKHQNCRKSEQAWDDYQAGISSCDSTSEVTQHEVSAAHTSLANLIVTARSTAETYANTDPAGKRACDLDQTEYEEHFCAWRAANYYACAASSDCTAHTGLNALRTSLLARASNRRNLWTTMEKMMCRVTYVMSSVDGDDSAEVSDFNETHSCENMAINASKFALDLEVPSTPECNDHAVASSTNSILVPSTVDGNTCTQFREAKYAWDEGQYAIPSVCFATCPVLTTYSTWEVPEDCIDEPGECEFYNHHRDACGSYDTEDFVAAITCCACGRTITTTTTTPDVCYATPSTCNSGLCWRMDITKTVKADKVTCVTEIDFKGTDGELLDKDSARASASSQLPVTSHGGCYFAAKAFGEHVGPCHYWCMPKNCPTGWLQYEFPDGTTSSMIASYYVGVRLDTNSRPEDWQMKQSTDKGLTWTLVDEQSGHNRVWTQEENLRGRGPTPWSSKEFPLTTTT